MTATTRIEDPNGLDWQAFSSRRFPGGRRHDLKAVAAYFAYKQLLREDAEGDNVAAEAVETWKTRAARLRQRAETERSRGPSPNGPPAGRRQAGQIRSPHQALAHLPRTLAPWAPTAHRPLDYFGGGGSRGVAGGDPGEGRRADRARAGSFRSKLKLRVVVSA
jgi:hypothetical protein